MKIETKVLVNFLKKVRMDGTHQIIESIFDFNEQGLRIKGMTQDETVKLDSMLSHDGFIKYEAIGKIGVQDIPTMIRILEKFGSEVEITVEGNIIKFHDNTKEMSTELMDVNFLKDITDVKSPEFTDQFTIDVKQLQEVIDDASINKEFDLEFTTIEKGVTISTSGKYKFKKNLSIPEAQGGVNVRFGTPFMHAVKNLTDNVILSMTTNFPVKILEKTEHSVITIVCAPLMKK